MAVGIGTGSVGKPLGLTTSEFELLESRIELALALARRAGGRAVAAITVPIAEPAVPGGLDVSAVTLAARRPEDHYFCFEQPDRDGYAVCGYGAAATVTASGERRFEDAARRCRELATRTVCDEPGDDPVRPAGTGPLFVGGFGFSPEGGRSVEWGSFAPLKLFVPEVSFARRGDETRMTIAAAIAPDEAPSSVLDRVRTRLVRSGCPVQS